MILGVALAATSALLLTFSQAPYDAWWLVWVALIPMVVAQHRVLPPKWSSLAPAIGMGGFLVGFVGGIFPPRAAWYMKGLPGLIALAIFLLGRRERGQREQRGYAWWPIAAGLSWVAVDLARSYAPMLGTWGFFGFALYRQPWLLQPVRVFGIFGLDLLIVLVNYALAMAVIAGLDRRGSGSGRIAPRLAARWCAVALVALLTWAAAGVRVGGAGDPTVRIAVAQPGVRGRDLASTSQARDRAMLDRLSAQTREAAARGARLVVWPEVALATDPTVTHAEELGELARSTGATLVVGYGLYTPEGARNEVITIDPRGQLLGRYGKDHPVGFLGGTSLTRGTWPTVEAPFGRMGSIICYDMDFTDSARKIARQGAKVIAVPSADWPAIATKHYTHSVFRALETGAAVAKSEYSVDSAIVDGYGRIVASAITPGGSAAVLVADVPLRDGLPLAARFGDWVGWLCVAALLARGLWRFLRRRSS